jgi:hypothetical protein
MRTLRMLMINRNKRQLPLQNAERPLAARLALRLRAAALPAERGNKACTTLVLSRAEIPSIMKIVKIIYKINKSLKL